MATYSAETFVFIKYEQNMYLLFHLVFMDQCLVLSLLLPVTFQLLLNDTLLLIGPLKLSLVHF